MELAKQVERKRQLETAASLTPIEVAGFITQKIEHAYFATDAKLAEWTKQRGQ